MSTLQDPIIVIDQLKKSYGQIKHISQSHHTV